MNTDNFEERIKNTFDHHRPEVDTDAIWENIEPRLKKKKRRRFILLFWLLGLGLLTFHFRHDGRDRFSSSAPGVSSEGIQSPQTPAAGKAAGPTGAPGLLGHGAAPVNQPASTTGAKNIAGGFDPVERTAPRVAAVEKNGVAASMVQVAATGKTDPGTTPENKESAVQTGTVPPVAAHTGAIDAVTPVGTETAEAGSDPAPAEVKTDEKDGAGKSGAAAAREQAETDRNRSGVQDQDKKADKNKKAEAEKPERGKKPKVRRSRWEHDLGIQAGPALAIRRLSGDGGVSDPAGLLEGRKQTERSMESFTAGIFYSAANRKGLVLKTGLDYRQTNEKFHLAYQTKETEVINGVLTVTVDNAGNVIGQSMGSKTITTTKEYSNTAYNHYRFVHLPIGIGYRQTTKKSRRELSGGIDFNLLFRAEGTIYNSDLIPTVLTYGATTYSNTFRRNTGMGLWASYACDWRLTDRLRWQLSAHAQIPLRPVSGPDYELVQRYFNVGAQVGLVYQVIKGKKGK